MPGRPKDPILSIRMPARLLERVRAEAENLGVLPSIAARLLIGAALGDDASMMAAREAASITEQARRRVLSTVAHELEPVIDAARERLARESEPSE